MTIVKIEYKLSQETILRELEVLGPVGTTDLNDYFIRFIRDNDRDVEAISQIQKFRILPEGKWVYRIDAKKFGEKSPSHSHLESEQKDLVERCMIGTDLDKQKSSRKHLFKVEQNGCKFEAIHVPETHNECDLGMNAFIRLKVNLQDNVQGEFTLPGDWGNTRIYQFIDDLTKIYE